MPTTPPSPAPATAPHPVDLHVGAIIRRLRKACGLSQELLAERIGVTFQQVQKYERGSNRVSASMLYEIAGALGVPISAFYEGLDPPGSGGGAPDLQRLLASLTRCEGGLELAEAFVEVASPEMRRILVQLILGIARSDR